MIAVKINCQTIQNIVTLEQQKTKKITKKI